MYGHRVGRGGRTLVLADNSETVRVAKRACVERNGRHEETRTPDLYRVKVAL